MFKHSVLAQKEWCEHYLASRLPTQCIIIIIIIIIALQSAQRGKKMGWQ